MEVLFKITPEIIKNAAQSQLGILALMILIVGVLAVLFFQQAPVQVRVIIFSLIFGATCAFGYAVVREIPAEPPPRPPIPATGGTVSSTPTPIDVSGEWEGQGPTDVDEVRKNFQYIYFPPGNMTFSFLADGTALRGTLRLRTRFYRSFDNEYGLLDGTVEGHRISFVVHTEFTVDDTPKVAIDRFFGDVDGNQIHFTVQEDTGHAPLQFTAVRRPMTP